MNAHKRSMLNFTQILISSVVVKDLIRSDDEEMDKYPVLEDDVKDL